jgi:broad specificity phosphatase PhoE
MYPDDLVAVVYHADPIKLALAYYLDLPLGSFRKFTINPGSISIFKIENQSASLIALNLIPPCSLPGL